MKEERFILAHNILGFSHQLLGSRNFGNTFWLEECMKNLMADRIQIKKNRVGIKKNVGYPSVGLDNYSFPW